MGFVNYTLKQCGYRYVQTASAKEIGANPQRWGAKKVTPEEALPGDIVLWNFSHVNFVYTSQGGKLSFVGGNQSPKNAGNNPNDGDVTQSWPSGWTSSRGGIVGIFRPSKT
jgi:cell wall-associated NlpC family hydrolase